MATDAQTVGTTPDVAVVDALDVEAVGSHVERVLGHRSRIDILFNALTFGDVQGAPLPDLTVDQVSIPVATALRGHLVPMRAVVPHMRQNRAGVVMTVTGYGHPSPDLGATGMAWTLIEALYRQVACDIGPDGVRAVWLRTGGFAGSILSANTYEDIEMMSDGKPEPLSESVTEEELSSELSELESGTMLGRLPSLDEAGWTAAFLASDRAGSVTATVVNLTGGGVAD